ncbi:MAG: hypothetical protein V3U76_09885 [Granulosicoccus sp.]
MARSLAKPHVRVASIREFRSLISKHGRVTWHYALRGTFLQAHTILLIHYRLILANCSHYP